MNVIDRLSKHILVDGFHVVADLDKSHGSWIVDKTTGKEYLDCYSQFASQALGWNHPKLQAKQEYLGKIALHKMANSDMYSEPYADFVEAFSGITPDFSHYFFIEGGALGVENALKCAFDWKSQKNRTSTNLLDVIHLKNAFHGRTGYTLSLTNTGSLKTKWFPKLPWTRITNPCSHFENAVDLEEKSLTEAECALKERRVAAILVESRIGEGGDSGFHPSYIQELRRLADEYEVLLIFDEVQTGMGLTGKMWCYEHYGIVPDLMCFGKKTQVCGFCSTDRIDDIDTNVFKVSGRINSTWGGNIVDMARCKVIIDIIKEDNLVENAAVVGKYFLDKLKELPVSNARGAGLMLSFDLDTVEERDLVLGKMRENMMVLTCGEKSIRFRPHLTFSKEDVDKAIEFIKEAF